MSTDPSAADVFTCMANAPIAFAQVREDPALDSSVLEQAGTTNLRVVMIASGGCTAAALAGDARVEHLHLVDVNPAQLALSRLKLHLLTSATPRERMEILGHAVIPAEERLVRLFSVMSELGMDLAALGPLRTLSEAGPDHCGRYEMLFALLRTELKEWLDELAIVLLLKDPIERVARVAPQTLLGLSLDRALERTMALPNLVALFGVDATRNSREPFSQHFANRIRHALATLSTADNPWLWQMLLGRFPPGTPYPWLMLPRVEKLPEIVQTCGTIDQALKPHRDGFDVVHLSNVLDWLSAEQARATLNRAREALRPGGCVFIRQLNSTLDIPALAPDLEWLTDEAAALEARDRSFFYRSLHLGRKRR